MNKYHSGTACGVELCRLLRLFGAMSRDALDKADKIQLESAYRIELLGLPAGATGSEQMGTYQICGCTTLPVWRKEDRTDKFIFFAKTAYEHPIEGELFRREWCIGTRADVLKGEAVGWMALEVSLVSRATPFPASTRCCALTHPHPLSRATLHRASLTFLFRWTARTGLSRTAVAGKKSPASML